jgi:thioredoxin 1
VLIVNETNFDAEVLEVTGSVLLIFMANWCPACQAYKSQLELFDERHRDKIKICIVDSDASPAIKQYYGVSNIPSTFLFLDGEEKRELQSGGWDYEYILEFVEHVLETKL